MKIAVTTIALLVCIFFSTMAFPQSTLNAVYYKNIIELLSKRQDISDVKYIEKKYVNGKIKLQLITAKYKDDSLKNRYWWIGKSFSYYKTGILHRIVSVDLMTKAFVDTIYDYNKLGKLTAITIFDTNPTKLFPKKVYYNFFSIFKKYYINFPDHLRFIELKNDKKCTEGHSKFIDNKVFVPDGEKIYYKEDGTVEKVEKYEKGVLIK